MQFTLCVVLKQQFNTHAYCDDNMRWSDGEMHNYGQMNNVHFVHVCYNVHVHAVLYAGSVEAIIIASIHANI